MKKTKILAALLALSMAVISGCGSTAPASSNNVSSEAPAVSSSEAADVEYPTDTVQLIVPLKPGGDTDLNARMFAKYLEQELGKSVVVVNVEGAGGTIGMDQVKDSKPDGHSVLFFHTEAMLTEIAGLIDYKLEEGFELAGTCIVDNTTVLATHKDAPYKTLPELVEYAKANPGEVEFGMQTGGYPHLIGLALEAITQTDFNLVDVGGNAAKTTALLGHKTDVINTQYGLNQEYFKNGEFINLGLCSKERNPLMPDLMTTTEQGFAMDFNKFFFCAMPKGTPEAVVNKFTAAMKAVCENPEFIAEASRSFLTAEYKNPQETLTYANEVYENLIQYKDLFIA